MFVLVVGFLSHFQVQLAQTSLSFVFFMQVVDAGRRDQCTKLSMPGRMQVKIAAHDLQGFLLYVHSATAQVSRTDGCIGLYCEHT